MIFQKINRAFVRVFLPKYQKSPNNCRKSPNKFAFCAKNGIILLTRPRSRVYKLRMAGTFADVMRGLDGASPQAYSLVLSLNKKVQYLFTVLFVFEFSVCFLLQMIPNNHSAETKCHSWHFFIAL